jgi:general secretion pathway protein I
MRQRGFTLVEVLATMLMMAIVLPAAMEGISLATRAADDAHRRTEAAGLAQAKLADLVAEGSWQGGVLAGDFSAQGWPDYHWQAAVNPWSLDTTEVGLQEIDVTVTWSARGRAESIMLSTLAYLRGQTTTSS